MLVCTIGDALLDVVVRLEGPIAADTDAYGRARVGAGGQAANVAAWVSALGGSARFVGKRADDPAGRLVEGELREGGVEVHGPLVHDRTGTVVSVATPDGRRAMLSDRGVAPDLRADELEPSWFAGCDRLHVPGYSLTEEPIATASARAAELVGRVSVDASSTTALGRCGVDVFRARVQELRADLLFANEDEAALLGDVVVETAVVKRGAAGCVVRSGGSSDEYAAHAAEVVDTTGAGDAFAAGYLLGGIELGLAAAARCVGRLGAMP